MKVEVRKIKINPDVFRAQSQKEQVDFESFISSLKNMKLDNLNLINEVKRLAKEMKIEDDVKEEIIRRIEEKNEGQKA